MTPTTNDNLTQPSAGRLLGVYPQKQAGVFLQRVKIFGGRMGWHQWRKVAELAAAYSSGFPLHVTTRQAVELHNILAEDIPVVQQGLAEVALTTFGACGDSLRNITVCPTCDFCGNGLDLMPLAQLVGQHLERSPAIFNLPRKFKISFSGCEQACARPWLSDLGFIAKPGGLFSVIGAGSLGARPALGIPLYSDMPTKDVLPVCVAAIEFFVEYGDRKNRRRARFRHVREKLGDETFRGELEMRLSRLKRQEAWPDVLLGAGRNDISLLSRLQLPNGNISPMSALELADVAEPKGAVLRINLEQGLEVHGKEAIKLPDDLEALTKNPVIVACPGSATCPRGLCDCWATAEKIREALGGSNQSDMRINISGCPNNCAHSAVADIGLVGMLRKEKGGPVQCYRLLRGGGNGRTGRAAEQSHIVRVAAVLATVKRLVK